MKKLALLLPLLALAAAPAHAEDPATNEPIRTLEEAAKRFRDYKHRIMGEAFYPYTIKINDMTGERKAWIFTCESHREVEVPKQDAEADEEEPEWTQTVETVVLRVDSSGKVDELSREPAEERVFPPLWPPSALNYCRAAGIDPDALSTLDADAETNMVFVVGTNAPIRVSRAELARAEKAYFFRTVAEADRIVVRDGGFDCCTPEEIIDRQKVFVVITNAAEIAAFTAMIRFEDGPGGGQCLCCGYPGIDWWKSGERVALTSVQHGLALRWGFFSDDYPFTEESSKTLVQWLKDRGISADMD